MLGSVDEVVVVVVVVDELVPEAAAVVAPKFIPMPTPGNPMDEYKSGAAL